MAPPNPAGHVPAWKKLGLQLKAPKDEPAPLKASKKRTISETDDVSTAKKQRLENKNSGKSEKSAKKKKSNKAEATNAAAESKKNPKKSRKSVSFATDTKSDDEDSDSGSDSDPEPLPDLKPGPSLTTEQRRAEKRRKREARAKNRPPPQKEDVEKYEASASDPILSYLSTFHKVRAHWKFQKNRETVLLKHAFSIDRIPLAYNAALRAYLAGLRGDAAKSRVAESAMEVIEAEKAELEKIEGQEDEKRKYEGQVLKFQGRLLTEEDVQWEEEEAGTVSGLDATWMKRLEKRKRAETVYFLMRGRVSTADTSKSKAADVMRKRKSRTAITEDSSSDDDTSSSGEDSSGKNSISINFLTPFSFRGRGC